MSPKTRQILGIVLIVAAIVGWLICTTSLVSIWVLRPKVIQVAESQVKVVKGALEVTSTGLEITGKSLSAVASSLETLQATVQQTASVIESTTPFFDSLITISKDSLPKTVEGLKGSLATAQQGAKVIDDALRKVTNLPLIGNLLSSKGYNPTTPLDQGLSQVSDGISKLDQTFQGITDSLSNTRDNVTVVQEGIGSMAANIGEINSNIKEAETVISQYQSAAESALGFINTWENRLPQLITILAVVLSAFFLWIALTQLGLFLQGTDYYKASK